MTAGFEPVPDDWRQFDELVLSPILAGAVDAFHERGYHGTSVRDIARRVGVTVPALYYHYKNKEAMLVALLTGSMADVLARCRAAVEQAGDRPERQFAHLVECIVLWMVHRRQFAMLDSEIRALSPENRRHYAAMRKELENLLLRIVEDGIESGGFAVTFPADTTRALLGMLQAIATWYNPEGPLTPEQLARRYVDIALRTVGAYPSTIDVQPEAERSKRSTSSKKKGGARTGTTSRRPAPVR